MLAHQCSVSVSALLAKATGSPSCRITAPSPILEASTWSVTGFLVSKYRRVGVDDMDCFIMLNCFSCEGVHSKLTSFFVSTWRGSWRSDSPWMNLLRFVTIPMNSCSSCRQVGAGIALIASTFSGSGQTPFLSYRHPKNIMESALSKHLSGLNMRPFCLALSISFHILPLCCSLVVPWTTI